MSFHHHILKQTAAIIFIVINSFWCDAQTDVVSKVKFAADQNHIRKISFNADVIDQSKGLSFNEVFSIVQDDAGFIWAGTQSGLNRYDGKTIKTFYPGTDSINSVSQIAIYNLLKASDGKIWVTAKGAPIYYDLKTDRVIKMPQRNLPNNIAFISYIETADRKILAASAMGIYEIDLTGNYKRIFYVNGNNGINDVMSMFLADNNTLWFGTYEGSLIKYNLKDKSYKRFLFPGHYIQINRLCSYSSGTLIGTGWGYGAIMFNENDSLLTSYLYYPEHKLNGSYNISRDIKPVTNEPGFFWVATYGKGIMKFNSSTGELIEYGAINPYTQKEQQLALNDLFIDKSNCIWLATQYEGMYRFDPYRQFITTTNLDSASSSSFNFVRALYQDESDKSGNTFWIGDETQLYQYNRQQNEASNKMKYLVVNKDTVSFYAVTKCGRDPAAKNMVASTRDGFAVFNPETGYKKIYKHNPHDSNSINSNAILSYEFDKNNKLWIGTLDGLCYLNSEGKFTRITLPDSITYKSERYKISNNINDIKFDSHNRAWLALGFDGHTKLNGIACYDQLKNQFVNFEKLMLNPVLRQSNDVFELSIDKEDKIYAALHSGLLHIDPNNEKSFSVLTTKDGLPSSDVYSVQQDAAGDVWILTTAGLAKYDLKKQKVKRYGKSYGLTQDIFYNNIFKGFTGEFYIADMMKLFSFNPQQLKIKSEKPPVRITDIIVNEQHLLLPQPPFMTKSVSMSYNDHSVAFEFAALDFSDPEANEFAYMLQGYDNKWISNGNNNRVQYSMLKPGDYIFKVKACNRDGVWNETGAQIQLHITPPFWQTWYFRLLAIVAIGLLIYYLVSRRINSIKHKAEIKQQLAESEMAALRAQMNPHFIFNCLNSINRFILGNKTDEASDYLNKFSQLIRLILENSRQQLIPVESELNALQYYIDMEQLRFEDSFDYAVNTNAVDTKSCKIPPMILQPYIENAIKHGLLHKESRGYIRIELMQTGDEFLKIIIEDNGVGREMSAAYNKSSAGYHSSLGTIITEKRIQLFGSNEIEKKNIVSIIDLNDESGNATGTRVEIILPIII